MLRSAWDLLINPVAEISRAKKQKNLRKTIAFLITEWVLIAVGVAIFLYSSAMTVSVIFFSVLLAGIALTFVVGFLVMVIFTASDIRGRFFGALTSVVYSIFPISVAVVLASLFSAITTSEIAVLAGLLATFIVTGIVRFYRAK